MNTYLKRFFAVCGCFPLMAQAQVSIQVDPMKKGPEISPRLYGIFFEEINHAGDGGLYAELVRNRSFEDNASNPDSWWTVGNAQYSVSGTHTLNDANPHHLKVVMNGANAGVRNEGYWGMNIVKGDTYKLSFWVRSESYKGTVKAQLQNAGGSNLGFVTITNDQLSVDGAWHKVTAEIKATGNDANGWLALLGNQAGTLYYDMVSLFPPTYKDRPNGCRRDLAEKLEAIHPKFLRFPGGCVVEGAGTVAVPNRFEWKKSRGPIEERPGHFNKNWNYPVTDGLGMLEYLQLAEDLGAEPLFVCNMGMGHEWEDADVEPYIQEALDAIEYCNGDASTPWGKKRIEDGHPEPFHLRLLEVGNENYWYGPYSPRYSQFVKRIGEKYPYIEFVGNAGWVGEWTLPWRAELIDQHFYESPSWFINSYRKYDTYDRSAPKVYVGEYAVTKSPGAFGNMNAALGEAVYMCGLERNSDVVKMASYAPIFMNEEQGGGWHPDMIRFNSGMSYGTPSYWVQQMNGENVGKRAVRWIESGNAASDHTRFALSSWGTSVKYDNLLITTTLDGKKVTYANDFSTEDLSGWTSTGGVWKVRNGVLCQTSTSMHGSLCTLDSVALGTNYTIELDATKVSGDEGFLVACNVQGSQDYLWWNLGGWGNSRHCIEQCIGNVKSTVGDGVDGRLESGRTYRLKMVVEGTNLKCYLDGTLVHDVSIVKPYDQKLYLSASVTEEDGQMYLKVVNPSPTSQTTTFTLANGVWTSGDVKYISSANGSDENSTDKPRNITPKTRDLADLLGGESSSFVYTVPAYSFCIFRLKFDHRLASEDPALPSPLVSYSFEHQGTDDSDVYPYNLRNRSAISLFDDGNHAFCSNASGYLDLTSAMSRTVAPQLTGDYAISIDLLVREDAKLPRQCWPFAFTAGTTSYLGLACSASNADLYYEMKKQTGVLSSAHSETGLEIGRWNNVVYSERDGLGTIYVNGYALGSMTPVCSPAHFGSRSMAYLAKSPISGESSMRDTYFDNFTIFGQAVTPGHVAFLAHRAQSRSTVVEVEDAITPVRSSLSGPAVRYNLGGQRVDDSYRGLVIDRLGGKWLNR